MRCLATADARNRISRFDARKLYPHPDLVRRRETKRHKLRVLVPEFRRDRTFLKKAKSSGHGLGCATGWGPYNAWSWMICTSASYCGFWWHERGRRARKLASPRVIPRQEARLAAGMPRQDVCLEVVLREAAMMLEAAPRASPTPYVGPNFVGARPWDAAPTCGTELCLWAVAPRATSDRIGGTEKSSVPHADPAIS